MQAPSPYRTNRDLFANHYLNHLLPETDAWAAIDEGAVEDAFAEIRRVYDEQRPHVGGMNEAPLEEEFVKPVLDALGHTYAVQEEVRDVRRYPDYAFFADGDAKSDAYDRHADDADFYRDAVAVGDAKRWGRKLDKLSGERRNFSNPSHQIYVYLQETPADWAILTNGKQWRLYYTETSHKLDSYYEVDLERLHEDEEHGLAEFKYFYNFFRAGAFVAGSGRESFLDRVYDRSAVFAQELGEDLEDNIYEAIRLLAEGFLEYPENDLDPETDLGLVHDSSLVYLYRLIFVFYAESEGRDLLDTGKEIYNRQYSLNALKREVHGELESATPNYRNWSDDLWHRLEELFELIDRGSESRGIPREDLYVPAYNGGLFRTEVDAETSREVRFLREHTAGDSYVARVIDLLARRESDDEGTGFVDYSSLDIRHLGSIYEGLLEYELNVADEPLAVDDGEYVPASSEEAAVEAGAVYLTTDKGERKATGSYYTPEYVVQYIVENTLDPLLEDIREDLLATREENFAEEFAERVFDLKILDPAMGSGHFLTNAVDHLANEVVDAQQKQGDEAGEATVDESHDIHWARRQVVQRCLYGVDLNPLAVELAKVSLWLRTLAAEQPLAFLDHHLKTGNSLVASDIEDIDELETDASDGPNASLADFGAVRRGTIDHLMDVYEEFIAIENTDLADAKAMERKYREIERDDLRNRLVAMANVKTAADFDLDLPSGAYERMARALDSEEEWADVAETDWFRSAQAMAAERNFLHWKLEFPEVFYEVDGSDRANPGFDAVIGNPPWIDVKGFDNPNILYELFATSFNRVNVYAAFCERSSALLRINGQFGFVTPNSYMTQSSYRKLRRLLLDEYYLESFVRLPDGVFDGVTMETAILTAKKPSSTAATNDAATVLVYSPDDEVSTISSQSGVSNTVNTAQWNEEGAIFDIFTSEEENEVLLTIESNSNRVDELFETCLGLTPYDKYEGHTEEQIENRVFHSDTQESEQHFKITTGSGIERYRLDWQGGEWIKYGDWLGAPRERRFFTEPRCVVRQIVSRDSRAIKAAYSESEIFHTQVGFVLLPKDGSKIKARSMVGVLNSKLMTFYHRKRFLDENKDTFQKILIQDIKDFALPSSVERNDLSELVQQAESLVEQRGALNLSLPDYLGTYDDGPTLGEFYQPPAGLADSILTDTATERENLRIGTVTVVEEGSKLVVRATARYKPEDGAATAANGERAGRPASPEAFETDRWGYTETEPMPAMEFVGLTEAERALIRAFVPHAVDEAGGFAGFREQATKTNSLIDRLEALTLPALSDVEGGLERYRRTNERAAELDEKIAKTDELIDQIVYRLYGLTEEEIAIVEDAVGR